ncbi:MAG TPA: hypothetical protein P5561_01455 [Candidatus Omnitrophota bacterium]|nr:hypothetical protein [Candidatus Omnitrophota bacterium]HRY85179.1 hypothetical protein [Candidatus Omnitrophota bacterium]
MALKDHFKRLIDLFGRFLSFASFKFTDARETELDELKKMTENEELLSGEDKNQLIHTVWKLCYGYKKAYEKTIEQSNERLERILLLSRAYQDLRENRLRTVKTPAGEGRAERAIEMEGASGGFNGIIKKARRIFSKGITRLEMARLSNLNKTIEREKTSLTGEKPPVAQAVTRLFSGYKRAYEEAATQSSERLERIRIISEAYQKLRENRSADLRAPNRKVAVIHVPKTGGTSLRHELLSAFPDATHLDAGNWPLERAEAGELDAFDIIFGHMYLHNLDKHKKDRYKVMFFRDPVTQAASVYAFLRSFAKDPVLSKRPDIMAALRYDFDTYIKTEDPNAFGVKRNRLARCLLGERFKDSELDETTLPMIKDKLEEIDFPGLYEHFTEDCQELLGILGAKISAPAVWLNKTPARMPKESISSETQEQILRKCSLDVEIYRLVRLKRQKRLETKPARIA